MEKCSVNGCGEKAAVQVILYDVYSEGLVFFEEDRTCPRLCTRHLIENEQGAASQDGQEAGTRNLASGPDVEKRLSPPPKTRFRRTRGMIQYPFTNRDGAQGFTIYKPLN